ncbi:MAG: hemolysin family protein [Gracilibacteraceae bacterium]|jgi:CBS domain containing-hemolysin-like protein|nr:hemolysin family protein [Gracilibacteraceae bacterium]
MSPADYVPTALTLLLLLLLSAGFSATETSFSSLNRIRLKHMADAGNGKAERALELAHSFDKLLTTTLVGNNIVNIAAASVATVWFVARFGPVGATYASIVVTVLVLIFGEVTPKSLAKESPEKFAMAAAPFIRALMVVLTPVNYIFVRWKKLLSVIVKSDGDPSITEDELLTIVEVAEHEGAINEQESELIKSAIEFYDLEVIDIFIPRVDISGVEKNASREEIAAMFADTGYSRLPVYSESIDDIIGVITLKDFYNGALGADKGIDTIMKQPVFITPSTKISALLKTLQVTKSHLAVISDEFGGTVGLVTMEDILEELVGEIWDEHDEIIEKIKPLSENSWLVVCSDDLDNLTEFFHLTIAEESQASTVNGWIIEQLGRIPPEGETFAYEGLEIKIHKADSRRVLEIIVTQNGDAQAA